MAVRIHVVASLNTTADAFRSALNSVGDDGNGSRLFRFGASDGWQWAYGSVWHTDSSDIENAVAGLPGTSLRITTVDGELWSLTLLRGDEIFRGVHYFDWVGEEPEDDEDAEPDEDFPDNELEAVAGISRWIPELQFLWDAEEEARLLKECADEREQHVEGLEDYTGYGVLLPEDTIAKMKTQGDDRACHTAFRAHQPQIVDALERFGVPVDRTEMLRFLLDEPLTSDADVGDLPGFLKLLAIEGVFSEADPEEEKPEEAGETQNEAPDWTEFPAGDLTAQVSRRRAETELVELAGGPVTLRHPALLDYFAHLCSEEGVIAVIANEPKKKMNRSQWPGLEVSFDQGCRIVFPRMHDPHWSYPDGHDSIDESCLGEMLKILPDGNQLELVFVTEGLSEPCHRYSGVLKQGQFEIRSAFPAVSGELLSTMFDLLLSAFGSAPVQLWSDAEEAQVRQYCELARSEVPRLRDGKVKPGIGDATTIIRAILFERFRDEAPWDMAGAEARFEKDWAVVNSWLKDDADAIDEPAAPAQVSTQSEHRRKLLYQGRTGGFYGARMVDLPNVSTEEVERYDAAMKNIGLEFVIEGVADADEQRETSRAYINEIAIGLIARRDEDNQYGWMPDGSGATLIDFSGGTREFHTHFEDGSSLITTSVHGVSSRLKSSVFVRSYEDCSLSRLWEKHLDGIKRMCEHRKTEPLDHSDCSEPQRCLELIDGLMVRYLQE